MSLAVEPLDDSYEVLEMLIPPNVDQSEAHYAYSNSTHNDNDIQSGENQAECSYSNTTDSVDNDEAVTAQIQDELSYSRTTYVEESDETVTDPLN